MEKTDTQQERSYCSRIGWSLLLVTVWSIAWQFLVYLIDALLDIFFQKSITEGLQQVLLLSGHYIISLPLSYFICRKRGQPPLRKRWVSPVTFSGWFVAGIFIMQAGNLLGMLADHFVYSLGGRESVNMIGETLNSMPLWTIGVSACLLAPLCEELVFRGLVANRLSRYGQLPAAVVSALLFALYHANLGQFFYAFGLGLLLAYAYFQSGCLIVPILLHMLYNTFGGLLPVFFSESAVATLLYLAADFLLSIAGAILLFRERKEIVWEHGICPPGLGFVFGNAGMILFILALFAETVLNYLFSM